MDGISFSSFFFVGVFFFFLFFGGKIVCRMLANLKKFIFSAFRAEQGAHLPARDLAREPGRLGGGGRG